MKVWHLPENVSDDICTIVEKAMVGKSAGTIAQVKAGTLNCTNNYCFIHWHVLTHTHTHTQKFHLRMSLIKH